VPADSPAGSGFPHAARLKKPHEFQSVFQQGRRINAAVFRLHVRRDDAAETATGSDDIHQARLGISVPKRVAPRSVDRNRIRRIVRENFRKLRPWLLPGDYVLVAQRDVVAVPANALREVLDSLWRRAGALKPEGSAPTMPIRAPKPAAPDPPPPRDPTQ
jgi:ribonuclease P protein component